MAPEERSASLEVRLMPIGSLRPAPYNPRRRLKSTEAAYKKLAASLREFGLVEPLVWNEVTGFVVGGHLRLQILSAMGVTEAPVSVVRLTPERERALNVVLNNREAQGRFDTERLADLLDELQELPELELTGFDESDLASLRLEPIEALPDEDGTERVEVTLTVEPEVYERIAPRLDELVREFDLVSHVRTTRDINT